MKEHKDIDLDLTKENLIDIENDVNLEDESDKLNKSHSLLNNLKKPTSNSFYDENLDENIDDNLDVQALLDKYKEETESPAANTESFKNIIDIEEEIKSQDFEEDKADPFLDYMFYDNPDNKGDKSKIEEPSKNLDSDKIKNNPSRISMPKTSFIKDNTYENLDKVKEIKSEKIAKEAEILNDEEQLETNEYMKELLNKDYQQFNKKIENQEYNYTDIEDLIAEENYSDDEKNDTSNLKKGFIVNDAYKHRYDKLKDFADYLDKVFIFNDFKIIDNDGRLKYNQNETGILSKKTCLLLSQNTIKNFSVLNNVKLIENNTFIQYHSINENNLIFMCVIFLNDMHYTMSFTFNKKLFNQIPKDIEKRFYNSMTI